MIAQLTLWLSGIELPPHLLSLTSDFLSVMQGGGQAMWVLFAMGLVLWFALGSRLMVLGIGPVGSARQRMNRRLKAPRTLKFGLLDRVAGDAISARETAVAYQGSLEHFVEEVMVAYRLSLRRYSTVIKTIVIAAPLIGLLGTIIGMIETFDALETMAVFSQSNSIAGGISKALFTTQMGLIVGVPGLLLGRLLDRRQSVLENQMIQIQLLAATSPAPNGSDETYVCNLRRDKP